MSLIKLAYHNDKRPIKDRIFWKDRNHMFNKYMKKIRNAGSNEAGEAHRAILTKILDTMDQNESLSEYGHKLTRKYNKYKSYKTMKNIKRGVAGALIGGTILGGAAYLHHKNKDK
jgi:hypothetical protein